MELINIKEVSSIETFDKELSINYIWIDEYKSFWYKRQAGFHFITSIGMSDEIEDVDTDIFIVENKRVYNKPHCTIMMNNESSTTKRFETYQEANQYASQIRSKCCNTIQLIEL